MSFFPRNMRWFVLVAALEAAQLFVASGASAQGVPPVVTSQVSSKQAYEKEHTYLTARVTGDDPKQYQWSLNGTNLPSETNFAIFFRSVELTNAGTYSLVVSNAAGSTSATVATLDVQPFRHNKMIDWRGSEPYGSYGYLYFDDVEDVVDFDVEDMGGIAVTKDGSVFTWGDPDTDSQSPAWEHTYYYTPPSGLSNVTQVVAGTSMGIQPSCAWVLRADGTVFGWNFETNVMLPIDGVVSIANGQNFDKVVFLKGDGTLAAWDGNTLADVVGLSNIVSVSVKSGEIVGLQNDGTVVTPEMDLPPGLTNIVSIAPGEPSYAVRSDGTVVGWSGTDIVEVPVGLTNVVAASSYDDRGVADYLAVLSDGSLMEWGSVSDPVPVVTNAFAVRAGPANFALVTVPYDTNAIHIISQNYNDNVLVGGSSVLTVKAESQTPVHYQWNFGGAAINGATNSALTLQNAQLSDAGTYTLMMSNDFGATLRADVNVGVFPTHSYVVDFGSPDSGIAPPGLSNIVGVAAGYFGFTVALKSDGTVVEWGYVEGLGVVTNMPGPANATNLVAIRAGAKSVVGLRKDGTVISWGEYGGLLPPAGLRHVTAIDAFDGIAVARKSDGSVVFWGQTNGLNIPTPLTNISTIRMGLGYSLSGACSAAIDDSGRPLVFGNFEQPPSGLSNIIDISLDGDVVPGPPAGATMGLALHSDGTLTCWGQDCGFTPPPDIVHVYPHAALDRHGNLFRWQFGDTNIYLALTDVIDYSVSSHAVALTTKLPIPALSISPSGTNMIASWRSSSTWILESKSDLSDGVPWVPVTDGQVAYGYGPYEYGPTVSVEVPGTTQRYFRLRMPSN